MPKAHGPGQAQEPAQAHESAQPHKPAQIHEPGQANDLARKVEAFLAASVRDWTGRAAQLLAGTPEIGAYDFRTAVVLGDADRSVPCSNATRDWRPTRRAVRLDSAARRVRLPVARPRPGQGRWPDGRGYVAA